MIPQSLTSASTTDIMPTALRSTAAIKVMGHIPSLDGIRGLAILLVMVHHFADAHAKSGWYARKMLGFAEAGWGGVDLFFSLSGFLITGLLIESKYCKTPLRTFYIRRTLRIFPLYYITLFLIFIVSPVIQPLSPQYQEYLSYQWWHWTYLPNFLILYKWPNATLDTTHFWSLAVEEQFYIFWPFVVLLTRIQLLKRVCLALFVGALAFRVMCFLLEWGHSPAYVLPFARLDALVGGAYAAIIVRDPGSLERHARLARLVLPLAILVFSGIVIFQGSFRRSPLMMTVGFSALAMAFPIMIGGVATNRLAPLNRIFECRTLRFFGKYSYAMYVFHTFILVWLLSMYPSPTDGSSMLSAGVPRIVSFTLIGIALTAAAGVASWVLIESHALKLRKFFDPTPH